MSQNISYICKMKKEDIYYSIIFYIALVGVSFLLSPILTYLFLVLGVIVAGIGFVLDVILSIVLWWAGFEGGIGETIMHWVDVMSPITAWIVFSSIATIFFVVFWAKCWLEYEMPSEKESIPYPTVLMDVAADFCPLIKDIEENYKKGWISKEDANYQIEARFKEWIKEKYNIKDKRDAEGLWRSKKWLMTID